MTTPDSGAADLDAAKAELRRRIVTARRALAGDRREAEAAALAVAVAALAAAGETVCAYWPVGTEPGSPAMIDGLLARGVRVLLPVVSGEGTLDWAEHAGELRAGPFGLLEPAGAALGAAAITEAGLVLVPALAVGRDGLRLGRGGGYYDRSLPLARPGVPLVAVVRDEELLETVPAAPHDMRVTAALTPGAGLVPLT
ncbi:MAG: 5-formyltetrahydrofolate cyclo-ligase [Pseudonocardiaceae bacterium]|nr:5-formyltetrahydrofolate cyclo-ligase [Pseudonocardiaceae bacterium]